MERVIGRVMCGEGDVWRGRVMHERMRVMCPCVLVNMLFFVCVHVGVMSR